MLLISGCTPSADSTVTTDMLTVQRTCTTDKCKSIMGSYDCVTVFTLSGCSQTTINYDVVATGSSKVSCAGSNCNGILNTWSDPDGNPITSITSRSYYICSWIDFNNNAVKDPADEFSSVQQTVNSSTVLTITSWGASAMHWFL